MVDEMELFSSGRGWSFVALVEGCSMVFQGLQPDANGGGGGSTLAESWSTAKR